MVISIPASAYNEPAATEYIPAAECFGLGATRSIPVVECTDRPGHAPDRAAASVGFGVHAPDPAATTPSRTLDGGGPAQPRYRLGMGAGFEQPRNEGHELTLSDFCFQFSSFALRCRSICMAKSNNQKQSNGSNLDFEAQLWAAANKMRGHMDASEYKHVCLGLIFLKYISDAFEEKREQLLFGYADPKSEWFIKDEPQRADAAENRDEYLAANVFWLPPEARWHTIKAKAKSPEIGKVIDDAMGAIERENPTLKGVLPRDYARPSLDKVRLGGLVDIISNIGFNESAAKSKDVLGRVYEYFLGKFASAEGKGGGEFYTPQCVVQVLVAMLEPYKGRVFDPCCGSGGMFVSSEKFVEEHGGRVGDLAVYGQESNYNTWKLARMNLAIRGIDANLGPRNADSFRADLHPDLKADFILANPPFNMSDWGGENLRQDVRWKFGMPPVNNANYAWIQHFIHHLSPVGVAGFVMSNGSMSTTTTGEGEIRKAIVEADLVDCMVALPGQLFFTTQIPVCLWFLARDKKNHKRRDRRGETLFIDARKMGVLVDRIHRELTAEEIGKISNCYHA